MKLKTGKIRLGLLFGGQSGEHAVSVDSARCVLESIDRQRYDVLPIRISQDGIWELLPPLDRLESLEHLAGQEGEAVVLSPCGQGGKLLSASGKDLKYGPPLDVIFPLLHGAKGEDGTIQGLLTLANVAYVGAEVHASAVGMDKVLMKLVFAQVGIAGPRYHWFTHRRWEREKGKIIAAIEETLDYPCFVKPANTGSSVGISKVQNREQLEAAVELTAPLDLKFIVEKAIEGRELECGVLGNETPRTSPVGEVIAAGEFYDYESKYHAEETRTLIPAGLASEVEKRVQAVSIQAFQAIDCCGMARVDFFLEKNPLRLVINEINTIPGFTDRSMFPMLWKAGGLSYRELINRLVELAMDRFQQRNKTL